MTNTLSGSAIETPNYHQAVAEAEKLGITLQQYQSMRAFEAKADKFFGPAKEDPDLAKARLALEKKQAEVDKMQSERRAAASAWDALLKEQAKIQEQRQCGEYMAEQVELNRVAYENSIRAILSKSHPVPAANEYPASILELGRMLAGAKEVLALVPAWREEIDAREAANNQARIEFAKVHGTAKDNSDSKS